MLLNVASNLIDNYSSRIISEVTQSSHSKHAKKNVISSVIVSLDRVSYHVKKCVKKNCIFYTLSLLLYIKFLLLYISREKNHDLLKSFTSMKNHNIYIVIKYENKNFTCTCCNYVKCK